MTAPDIDNSNVLKLFSQLFDEGNYTVLFEHMSCETEVACGLVGGVNCFAFAQNKKVNSGALSSLSCNKLIKAYSLAEKTGVAIIGIYDSNGIKLDEGFKLLDSYGQLIKKSSSLSGVIPQISVIIGAALGSSAVIANMADAVICTKDADFYVNPPSGITACELMKNGAVDFIADDENNALEIAKSIVSLLPENNLSSLPILEYDEPQSNDYKTIEAFADSDSLVEFKKNYAQNVRCALGTVCGVTTGFVAFLGEKLCPACIYKAEAFIKLCDAYNISIVTLADSSGIINDNESQLLISLTKLTSVYASATCPKISLITNKSVGSSYLTLCSKGMNADLTYAFDGAVVSPLDSDSAVAFLYGERLAAGEDRQALKEEYESTLASPLEAAKVGAIDGIINETEARAKIIEALDILSSKREQTIARKHSVK